MGQLSPGDVQNMEETAAVSNPGFLVFITLRPPEAPWTKNQRAGNQRSELCKT